MKGKKGERNTLILPAARLTVHLSTKALPSSCGYQLCIPRGQLQEKGSAARDGKHGLARLQCAAALVLQEAGQLTGCGARLTQCELSPGSSCSNAIPAPCSHLLLPCVPTEQGETCGGGRRKPARREMASPCREPMRWVIALSMPWTGSAQANRNTALRSFSQWS